MKSAKECARLFFDFDLNNLQIKLKSLQQYSRAESYTGDNFETPVGKSVMESLTALVFLIALTCVLIILFAK